MMDGFAGAYGGKRRAAAASRLHGAVVEQSSVVIRKVGRDRGGELSAHRVLSYARVTPERTLGCLAQRTAAAGAAACIVVARRPRNAVAEGDVDRLTLTLVEAVETHPPDGETALHWRLLTTLPAQALRVLKSDGLRLEEAQAADPRRLSNLAALAVAAARIIQLADARDGSARPASDVATEAQVVAAAALCPRLEGETERQPNPHPARSLAWMSWIIARLGGWNRCCKPPGPKTMRDGRTRFAAIADRYALAQKATHDA